MTTARSITFNKFLQDHKASAGEAFTHTRIGDKEKDIYGGVYNISDDEWKTFMQLYYQDVIVKGQLEYLTEKQLVENGPIMIDIDFRYDKSVTIREHKPEHIVDALAEYFDQISELVDVANGAVIDVFVMEKNDVNILEDKTKDGIHIIIGMQMHKALQAILRTKMIPILKTTWDDLPVVNTWNDILDEGVTKGSVNWQVYGSRKPGNKAYMIKYHYKFTYTSAADTSASEADASASADTEAGTWDYALQPLAKFSTEKNLLKLSARYTEHPGFPMKKHIYEAFEANKKTLNKKETVGGTGAVGTMNPSKKSSGTASTIASYGDIKDEATLDAELDKILDKDKIDALEYKLKEVHDYTMILPIAYYGPGSYNKWIKVGMALRNESYKLFLTWLKFSSQDNCRDTLKGANGKFDWTRVPELFQTWERFNINNQNPLTYKSIMYWAKNEVREKYDAIWKESIDFFVKESLKGGTAFDLAAVLYSMKKDRYVCTAIKNKIWYEYINHRWHEIDSGNTLRMSISKEMHKIFATIQDEKYDEFLRTDPSDPVRAKIMESLKVLSGITTCLKQTQPKENIMKEAREHFYDNHFLEELDKNTHLLCFNNGVIDFKQKIFRKGNPEDCLSKCTKIDYIPYQTILRHHATTMREIETFMSQVFPIKDLEVYMWDHLAACLIGVNKNQTFNVYKGTGANGKSILTDLMIRCMGTYAKSISVALLTTKPASIGSSSSEVAQTPGVRYLIMGEPNKGDKLVEGTMKLYTGGDEIQARQLFQESKSFVPQFKMILMTNNDLDITTNDDGTWRRMRYVDFLSKFTDKPYEGEFNRDEYPYQFPDDKNLKDKLDIWAPVFMSMLVERAYKTGGIVKDCDTVLRASKKKREDNDYLAGFVRDKVRRKDGNTIKKTELLQEFKIWYLASNPGSKTIPKGKEIIDYMNIKFGECGKNGWRNTELNYEQDDDEGDTPGGSALGGHPLTPV
jgi:P4 family phage/plasmid primase-like protien